METTTTTIPKTAEAQQEPPKKPDSLNLKPGQPTPGSVPLSKLVSEQEAQSGATHTKNSGFGDFGTFGKDGNTATAGSTGTVSGASLPLGLLDGEFILGLTDMLIPSILVAVLYAMGQKVPKGKLQLSEKEKTYLSPIVQKCLDSIQLNFNNPWHALAIAMGICYGSKFVELGVVTMIDKKMQEKEKEKPKDDKKAEAENPIKAPPVEPKVEKPNPHVVTESELKRIMEKKKLNRERAVEWIKKTKPETSYAWMIKNKILDRLN